MSEPELAYMSGNNDDFDLPRWQNHHFTDPLSSSAQAAQAAQQAAYTGSSYAGVPLPPPPQSNVTSARQPPQSFNVNNSQSMLPDSAKQPRMSHLFEGEQAAGHSQPHYLSSLGQSSLSRSASMGGAVTSAGHAGIGSGAFNARRARHNMPDDLESAFTNEASAADRGQQHRLAGSSQQISQSFYPPSVPFHQTHQTQINSGIGSTTPSVSTDPYQDGQYASSNLNQPRRANTRIDDSISSRSPRRTQTQAGPHGTPIHEQFSQHAAQTPTQYSPTSAYQYANTQDMLGSTSYQYHSTSVPPSQAVVKTEPPPTSPLASPYGAQRALPPPPAASNSLYTQAYPMDTTSPGPSTQNSPMHLTSHSQNTLPLRQSLSTPSTPLSYHHPQSSHGQVVYQQPADDPSLMSVEVSHKRRASGFKRVRDQRDLRPYVNAQPAGRRGDTNGQFLSPLRQLTTHITDTYHICNPQFRYESAHNPRRVLTKPSKPMHNEGYDNEDYDYILYVNDWLGSDSNKYLILDVLGQGTFGQVVKCQNMKTHEIVAVKVVKNKPAYFNQSMMEVTILELLNNQCDPHDEHHILRLRDSFIHKNHLCLVFELLSSNLYELIKQNQFQGLSTQLVKVFTAQLLDALTVLKEARLIHCDLKPENILLKSLQSPTIKVIDFGSACHERQTVYTYIQSRFYRSPEVLLGLQYNTSIDMWSLGCIAVELFLGLPLFPGTSEYNQITRIVEMLGLPPAYMLENGKQSGHFFDQYIDHYGQKKYKLKSIEQYSRERNTNEQPGKQYFKATSFPDIINNAPMPNFKSSSKSGHEVEKELMNRAAFIDFCQGLLNLDPQQRWTPQQARMHPFITGEKFTKPFVPTNAIVASQSQPSTPAADPKRPYGGLVPSQPKGQRAFQDAAQYNLQLAQHQAATAQAQAASQASNTYRNPYGVPQPPAQQSAPPANSMRQDQQYSNTLPQSIPHSHSMSSALNVPSSLQPNPPSSTYYPNQRLRSNTIGNMSNNVDAIPPALARLRHMNNDVIQGRNALTPVLNRDDAMREWERRQSGQPPATHSYPQLEYLQQQAELVAGPWTHSRRYQAQPSSLSQSFQPPGAIVVDEPDRRDAALTSARTAARADPSTSVYATTAAAISSPPQAYPGGSMTTANRYAPSYAPQGATSGSFDTVDRRGDMNMYAPMQPDQYQSYGQSSPSHAQQHHAQSSNVPQSFYNSSIATTSAPQQQQRNPFQAQAQGAMTSNGQQRDPRWGPRGYGLAPEEL